MDVSGERILIFGDSLTHNGADSDPEIWDVNAGSDRSTSAPGDLLASLLFEQGASAVRTDANVGRSAHNFWAGNAKHQFHSAADLIVSDQAFAPTKVIVMLGTNDADSGVIDANAMQQIRDTYANMGAEVWAIGPPVFANATLSTKADQVYSMMSDVFGDRLIDARPLSSTDNRAGDGMHFQPQGAQDFAYQLASTLASTPSSKIPWLGISIGVGLFGVLGYLLWRSHKSGSLTGPSMLKVIASESRSPEEYARRAEAWASAEAKPPSVTTMVRAYRGALPGKTAKLIREAREQREVASRQRFKALINQPDDDLEDLGGHDPEPKQTRRKHEPVLAYFVDPETGETIEVDLRTAKYRREGETEFRGSARLDKLMAQQSLKEEREAIDVYGKRLKKAESPKLKKALRHARKEEREHAAAFRSLAR